MSVRSKFLVGVIVAGLALSACASSIQPSSDLTAVPAVANTAAVLLATPTARVLTRPDQASEVAPPDRNEVVGAPPKVGSVAPDFTLSTLSGGVVTLSKLRGHPVLINFWASWCVACRAEAPELQKLYAEYGKRGLIVLGVNTTQQDTVADARAYVSEFKLTFDIPMDEKGNVARAYRVVGLPTSFFVDSLGVIRQATIGQMDHATMLEGLVLAQPRWGN